MSDWRIVALERFPELKREIELWEPTPSDLWIWELLPRFMDAHNEPMDRDFIRRVYEYAMWSLVVDDDDINSAAIICFYEDIPDWPAVRRELPNYMTMEEFDGLVNLFRYGRTEEAFEAFVREFREARRRLG